MTALVPSWELALQAAGKSPKTVTSYLASVRSLARYLRSNGLVDHIENTAAGEVRAFLLSEIERTSAASAQVHYRNLRVWFGWLVREGERAGNPMDAVDKPKVPDKVRPFLSPADLGRAAQGSQRHHVRGPAGRGHHARVH